MIRGKLKQLLVGNQNQQDLFKFVDSALQSQISERKAVLEVFLFMYKQRKILFVCMYMLVSKVS